MVLKVGSGDRQGGWIQDVSNKKGNHLFSLLFNPYLIYEVRQTECDYFDCSFQTLYVIKILVSGGGSWDKYLSKV